jgi:hypothetical protein
LTEPSTPRPSPRPSSPLRPTPRRSCSQDAAARLDVERVHLHDGRPPAEPAGDPARPGPRRLAQGPELESAGHHPGRRAAIISSCCRPLYQNHRTQLKIAHVAETAQVKLEQLKQLGGVVVPAAQLGEAIVTTVNPDLKPQLDQINAQVQRLHDAVFGPATAAAPAAVVDPAAWSGGSAAAPTPPPTAPPQSIPTSPPPTSPPCIEQTVQLPADDQPTETLPPLYIDPTVVTDPRQ